MSRNYLNKILLSTALATLTCAHVQIAEATPHESIKRIAAMQHKETLPSIRILIARDVDSSVIEVKGQYLIVDPYKGTRLADRSSGKRNLMQPLVDGLKWGEGFPSIYQLHIIPISAKGTTLVDGFEYRGSLYVYDIGGKLSIVNEVSIEDYLSSVMTSQIDGTYADEVLAAAAITARTNAYHLVQTAKNPFWHIEAANVGYLGYGITCRYNGIEDAISTTKHMVMSNGATEDGALVTFPSQVVQAGVSKGSNQRMVASLSLEQADKMAKSGNNAAQILAKIFPHTSIKLIHARQKAQKTPVASLSNSSRFLR